jgi:hypothetical protein
MQAVAFAAPVTALELLYINSLTQYKQAYRNNADETQVYSPQYVFLYFQICLSLVVMVFIAGDGLRPSLMVSRPSSTMGFAHR